MSELEFEFGVVRETIYRLIEEAEKDDSKLRKNLDEICEILGVLEGRGDLRDDPGFKNFQELLGIARNRENLTRALQAVKKILEIK